MSLGETIEFLRACFANRPNITMIFIRSANIVPCYLIFLSILRRREARRVHVENLMSQTSSYLKLRHTRGANIFVLFLSTWAPPSPNLFSITGIKVVISGIAFLRSSRSSPSSQSSESTSIWSFQNFDDRPDRPDRTQLYPSDRDRLSRPDRLRSFG